MLNYRKAFFDPATLPEFTRVPGAREDWAYDAGGGDEAQRHFVFAEEAVLAINVALATNRPLLISGEPGSGKTSLARFASRALSRVFYRETVTSRTQASDLLASFDALKRLSQAQVKDMLGPTQAYVVPGKLWWALSPKTAAQRGLTGVAGSDPLIDPYEKAGFNSGSESAKAALLLDEIDKADPDVPNDLLESLDEGSFTVAETGDRILPARDDLLIMLTTNGERELPPAFLRRCVTVELPKPNPQWLFDIGQRRFGEGDGPLQDKLYARLADDVMERRKRADEHGARPPSTSEFVDAVRTCRELLADNWLAAETDLSGLLDMVLAKGAR